MKLITVWERQNEKGEWEHNHIEDGHVEDDPMLPTPICPVHKQAWKRGHWKFTHAYLSDDIPPKIVNGS